MSILKPGPQPVLVDGVEVLYGDGRTKQSFKDSTDINKILRKAQKAGSLSHLVRHGASYGDFSDIGDLLTAHQRIQAGDKIYQELPSSLKKEFQDQFAFFEYVNGKTQAELQEALPDLAEPGRQLPNVVRTGASEANPAVRDAEPPAGPPVAPPGPPEE